MLPINMKANTEKKTNNNDSSFSYTWSLSQTGGLSLYINKWYISYTHYKIFMWVTGPHSELKGTFIYWKQMGTSARHATEHPDPLINFTIRSERQHLNGAEGGKTNSSTIRLEQHPNAPSDRRAVLSRMNSRNVSDFSVRFMCVNE